MDEDQDFDDHVHTLNSDVCLQDPSKAKTTINIIQKCFTAELSHFSIDLFVASALDDQNGVPAFIRKTAFRDSHKDAVLDAFALLEELLKNYTRFIEPYFSSIIPTCIYVLNTICHAFVKVSALRLLKIIIETPVTRDIKVDELISKLKEYLAKEKNPLQSIREELFMLLGAIFESYPDVINENKDWFLSRILKFLNHVMKESKHKSASTVNGCFEGLRGYLSNFIIHNEEQLKNIYEYMKFCSKYEDNQKHVTGRAALHLLEKSGMVFDKYIYADCEYWQNILEPWLKSQNKDDKRSGFNSMTAFYKILIRFVESEKPSNAEEIFKKFFKYFCSVIRDKYKMTEYHSFETWAAVIGIGEFSLLKPYSDNEDLSGIFQEIIKFAQNLDPEKNSSYFPIYVECISKYVSKLSGVKIDELGYLQRLSVLLIEQYPKIDQPYQHLSYEALEKSFYCLFDCGMQVLDNHIKEVIYQGLIRSCAHTPWIDVELQKEAGQDVSDLVSYKSYLSLWQYLLNLSKSKVNKNISFTVKSGISSMVADSFIISFLKIIKKLDLEVVEKRMDISDPEEAMEAANPKDFQIFINIVDLYQDLIPVANTSLLSKWFMVIFQEMVEYSYKSPVVSGYYKVISATLKATHDEKFFDENEKPEFLIKYLEDVLVKVNLYKGDLQIACLQTILSAPVCLIEDFAEKTVPAFQVILRVGRGYFPLLKQCIVTLEQWYDDLPMDTMKSLLKKILPHFDLFLQSKGFRDPKFEKLPEEKAQTRGRIKKKLQMDPNDSQLLMLQRRFLVFIGKLDPEITSVLIETEEEGCKLLEKNLIYKLPFPDMKPEINLDTILPRIIDLSLSCGDRSTRMTACELLHSIVMITLGNMKQMDGGMTGLFKQLVKSCLSLGCDTDHIVKQLFEPLCLQIVRYFSGKQQHGTKETAGLIEVLMEAVSHPYDSAVRDFAATCTSEFIKWSIKHTTPEELKRSPENIRAILRNIYSFALHPSYNKRLGAALVFNNIYSILREEEFILDAYWLEIYYYFMESLKMSEAHEDKTQIINAIRHVERPILEKYKIFSQESSARKCPPGFGQGLLVDVVKYTLNQCRDVKIAVREIAMSVVEDIVPKFPISPSIKLYIDVVLLESVPELKYKELGNEQEWFEHNQAFFNYYGWLLQHEGVLPDERLTKAAIKFTEEINLINSNHSKSGIILLYLKFITFLNPQSYNWDIIIKCIFSPSIFNIKTNHKTLVEILINLLKKIKMDNKLTSIFALELNKYDVPQFQKSLTRNELEISHLEYLNGLKIIRKADLWDLLKESTHNKINGDSLLKTVFESLFEIRFNNKKEFALNLDPTVKNFGEELLKFAVELKINPNIVIEYSSNNEEVINPETNDKITKGDYLLLLYKRPIYECLIDNYDTAIEFVFKDPTSKALESLISILQTMHSAGIHKNRKEIAKKIFSKWKEFENHSTEKLLFSLLKSLAKLHHSPVGFLKKQEDISSWIFKILKKSKITLDEIESIFTLIPHLTEPWEEITDNQNLWLSLLTFWRNHKFFQVSSYSTAEFNVLNFMYNQLFFTFQKSASIIILKFILKIIAKHLVFLKEEKINESLRIFATQTPGNYFEKRLYFLHDEVFLKPHTDYDSVITTVKFLVVLLRENGKTWQFIEDKLQRFVEIIVERMDSSSDLRVTLARKMAALSLIENWFLYENLENVSFTEKRELLKILTVHCADMKEACPSMDVRDLHRKYLCACLNTLCAIIMRRGKSAEQYRSCIFSKVNWKRIVDNEKEFDLTMDFDEKPKLKKILTSLRKSITAENQAKLGRTVSSIKYLQSQTLFQSSLHEDVTKFDFTHSPIRSMDSVPGLVLDDVTTPNVEILLEIDTLNDHECMVTLMSIVAHMIKENITPLPDDSRNATPPCWLKSFLTALESRDAQENTKLFVLKVLYNLSHIYDFIKPYVNFVFKPVLLAISDLLERRPINYFVIDLIVMMIEWKSLPNADEHTKTVLTLLVGKLIEKTDALRKDIVKDNLETLKTIVEVWKDLLYMEELSKIIFDRIMMEEAGTSGGNQVKKTDEMLNYMNLNLAGMLLSNEIPPWRTNQEKFFLSKIFEIFERDNKNSTLAGQTIGLALKFLKDDKSIKDFVTQRIGRKGWGGNISLLHAIHSHYPSIILEFHSSVVQATWSASGALRTNCLEMLLTYVSEINELKNDLFATTIDTFLPTMMKPDDIASLNLSLQITEKIIDYIDERKLIKIANEALKFKDSKYPPIRKSVYNISIKFLNKYENDLFENEELRKLREECRKALLRGLTDFDGELQDKCVEFWKGQMGTNAHRRLLFIFQKLYTPETNEGFLSYATRLMLESSKSTPEYTEMIFQHPIHECEFRHHNVLIRAQHSTMAPMFAQTLTSQLNRTQTLETLTQTGDLRLRQTIQSLMFQPTVNVNNVDVEMDLGERKTDDEIFKIPARPPRRRHLKNTANLSYYFAKREINKKKVALEIEQDRIKKRDTHVELYRSYRIGDYPDIQIQHSQILKPLEVLIKRDSQIAKQFLIAMFSGIADCLNETSSESLFKGMNESVVKILENPNNINPAVASFIFEIALYYDDKFELKSLDIKNAAKASGWLSLGTLLIEENIILKEDEIEDNRKKQKGAVTKEEERWLHLAELYHSLKEFDVLRGIFIDKITVEKEVNEAIHCEAFLDWSAAAKNYESVFLNGTQTQRFNFYNQSYFNCLANLSDWKKLNVRIRDTIDHNLEKLWDNGIVDQFLPWFLRSQMMISFDFNEDIVNRQVFKAFIKNSCEKKENFVVLANRFCEELAITDLLSNRLQKAGYYVDQLYLQFLSSWSHLNKWSGNLRGTNLANLQLITELHDMVNILGEHVFSDLEMKLSRAWKSWEKNFPNSLNDLLIWDVKLSYREQLWDVLKEKDEIDVNETTRYIIASELNLVEAAIEQDNFYLARCYLKKIQNKLNDLNDHELKLNHEYYCNCMKILKAKHSMNDVEKGVQEYAKAWMDIDRRIAIRMDTEKQDDQIFIYKSNLSLGKLISTITPYVQNGNLGANTRQQIASALGLSYPDDIAEKLKAKGMKYIQNSVDIIKNLEGFVEDKAKTYLTLAKYYRDVMGVDEFELCEGMVVNLLKAMALGNLEARQLFCCILTMPQLVENGKSLDKIKNEIENVPIWMFLMWTNQMLASVDTKMYPLINNVLLAIAEEYPNAIRYGFRLSMEKYKFKDETSKRSCKQFVKQLNSLLANSLYEKFIQAMHYVGNPNLMLRHYLDRLYGESKRRRVDLEEISSIFDQLFSHLYNDTGYSMKGPMFGVVNDLEDRISQLRKMEINEDFRTEILDIVTYLQTKSPRAQIKFLKSYSPWLNEFQALNHDCKLEIPGQYDGLRKPILKYHVTIASFKYDVLELQSKCKPLRMTILGNDAEEYKFLIKFGEDLRQDQRIQQFFNHVNYSFKENKQTKQYSIDTYNVIPLSSKLGMIQWIDNCSSLGELVKASFFGNFHEKTNEVRMAHLQFISKKRVDPKRIPYLHIVAYNVTDRNQAVVRFNESVHSFPWDLLRKAFWKLSTCPEHFVYLRSNFAVSQAITYIAHWLIGIGDRHLQNTLVSTNTGRVLGIDFGLAFGSATQLLPIPELVPFRLAPQILNLLKPLNESGWIKQTMIHCLRSFRKDNSVFLAILEVFVLEPSLDWLEQARRDPRNEESSNIVENWQPREKISTVKEKLEGANPVAIFENDIETYHSKAAQKLKYIEVLKGVPELNIRARLKDNGLTEEEQVDCLIDLATDQHVLAKTYIGWDPWL